MHMACTQKHLYCLNMYFIYIKHVQIQIFKNVTVCVCAFRILNILNLWCLVNIQRVSIESYNITETLLNI